MSIQVIQEKGRTLYLLNGKLHREDGPAIEWDNGDEEWYLYGKRSRADGPAVIKKVAGTPVLQKWYRNDKKHNTTGPAVIKFIRNDSLGNPLEDEEWWEDGIRLRTKKVLPDKIEYRKNDQYHRKNSPAVVWDNGSEDWFIYGKRSRTDGPALIRKKDGVTILEEWWKDNKKTSFNDQPAVVKLEFTDNLGNKYYTYEWWTEGELSRSTNYAVQKFVNLDSLGSPLYEYRWYRKGKLNRSGNPAIIKPDGSEEWYTEGKLNRANNPAVKRFVLRSAKGVDYYDQEWYTDGVLHNTNTDPAVIKFARLEIPTDPLLPDIAFYDQEWYTDGKRNRSGNPAVVKSDGSESWYSNGVITRTGDNPALIIYAEKDELGNSLFDRYWYIDGKLSRGSDKPAVLKANYDQEWYTDGKRSRVGNPAIIRGKGDREWWLDGKPDRADGPAIILADGVEPSNVANPYIVIYEPLNTTFTSSQITTAFGSYSSTIISITREFKVHTIKLGLQTEENLKLLLSYLETQTINGFSLRFGRINYGTESWITQAPLASVLAIYEPSEVTFTSLEITLAFGDYADQIDSITKVDKVHNVKLKIIPENEVRTIMAYVRLQRIDDNLLKVRRFTSGQVQRDSTEPGIVTPNGRTWFVNGKIERDGAPAIILNNGDQFWYKEGLLHRTDGPAVEKVNGDKEWYINGNRTRLDSEPAVELINGTREWWVNGSSVRFGNLPSKIVFAGSSGNQKLWIKTFPVGGLKNVFKTDVTNNGSYNNTLTWVTTNAPIGSYYYVSESSPNNYGVINLIDSDVDPPTTHTYSVTLNMSGNFFLKKGVIEGERLSITLKKGDTLIFNINTSNPLFDERWFNVFNSNTVFKPINSGSITSASTKTLKFPLQLDIYKLEEDETITIDDPELVKKFNAGTLLYIQNGLTSGYVTVVDKKTTKDAEPPFVSIVVEFYPLNTVSTISWTTNSFVSIVEQNKPNRTDGGPAFNQANGDKIWYKEGYLYRDGVQPAVERGNGDKEWYNGLDLVFKASTSSNINSSLGKRVKVSPQNPDVNIGSVLYINSVSPGYVIVVGKTNVGSTSMKLDLKYYLLNTNTTVSWTTTTEMKLSVKGNLHRIGNPAIIKANGDSFWYKNGLLHRIGQPAVEKTNGDKEWYVDGKLYRDDVNPAIEKGNGDKYWYNSYTLITQTTESSSITPLTTVKIKVSPQIPEINNGSILYIAGTFPGYVEVTSRRNIDSNTMELGIKYSQLNISSNLSWGDNVNVILTIRGKLHRVEGPAIEYANGSVEYWLKGVKQP